MKRVLMMFAVLALCLPMVGETQSIQYNSPGGLKELTSSGTAVTSTVPIRIPNGSNLEYAELGWNSNTFYISTVQNGGASRAIGLLAAITNVDVVDGTLSSRINFSTSTNNGLRVDKDRPIGWVNGAANTSAPDLVLRRDDAATLQLGTDAATATAQTIKGSDSTGSGTAGGALTLRGGAGTSGNAKGGNLILGGGANAGTEERGAVTIEDGGTKPTCSATVRGAFWYDAGGAGVADTFEVCRKDAADAYAWVSVF